MRNVKDRSDARNDALLSDRLLAVLTVEMQRLEASYEDINPSSRQGFASNEVGAATETGAEAGADVAVQPPTCGPMSVKSAGRTTKAGKAVGKASSGKAAASLTRAKPAAGVGADLKARIEAIGQMTRTLEKLLELKQLEALAMRGADDADDAETLRLREEMMKRLKAIDAQRLDGAGLFGEAEAAGGDRAEAVRSA
ncbi:hypothetical protein [Consotaella aegiceratis]|uniref:hypothetical protein n=1 Tax=Consotaella aegiceratis TaxID=3097961 RepID=UPI002F413FE8